jgi:hypothetical protein
MPCMRTPANGTKRKRTAMPEKKRLAVGAHVMVVNPGMLGVVTQADDEPTIFGEYWHTIKTEHGEEREPGSNLELVPTPMTNTPSSQSGHNIHLHGDHSRVNVNSTDNSTNVISESNTVLFARMREQATAIDNTVEREAIVGRVVALEKAQGSSGFFQAYQDFIESAANHMTLFAPFLPALAHMLQQYR